MRMKEREGEIKGKRKRDRQIAMLRENEKVPEI